MNVIEVIRTDNTVRLVTIYPNEIDGKYQFVNLTSGHICKCKFKTIEDALFDLQNNDKVKSWSITQI